jgi:4-hydroxybenzoate polyprenyltransferase/phosphoserine phosphatase
MDLAPSQRTSRIDVGQLAQVPLVVDLDGTLLRSDTLVESLFAVARTQPLALLKVPHWLAQGRAHLKQALAARAAIDASTLPLDQELLNYLRVQKRQGRRIILASGADEVIARAVAQGCGLFDAVMASDGAVNLAGAAKRERLVAEFGERGFDYVGNSARDLPVWAAARHALLMAPSPRLTAAAQRVTEVEHVFAGSRPRAATYFGAMRFHHWLKNALLLVPLLFAHNLYDPVMFVKVLIGAICFSLAASGIYLLNDLLDLNADRRHPHKRMRALASGQMPIVHALVLLPCLWLIAAAVAMWLPRPFLAVLGVYVALMVAYSVHLTDVAIVDALVLAIGYSLRILAGALVVGLAVSPWLLVCSTSMFFGLALLKRYAELVTSRPGMEPKDRVRAYRIGDATIVAGLGVAAGCSALVLLALYPIIEPSDHMRWIVWLVCGLLLFWTGHMWLMAHRGLIHDDPVTFALRDPLSRVIGLLTVAVLLLFT